MHRIQEIRDDLHFTYRGSIKVLPYGQRQLVFPYTSAVFVTRHCRRKLSNARPGKHPLVVWTHEGWWAIETVRMPVGVEYRGIDGGPVDLDEH